MEKFFSNVFCNKYKQETYLIYGLKDEIAPNEAFLSRYFDNGSAISHVDMEHKLDKIGANKVYKVIMNDYQK